MVLGQYGEVLVGTRWYWVSISLVSSRTGLQQGLKPVCIEKSGDLVGCHDSGRNNEQGKIEPLSQWTADMSNISYVETDIKQID